MDVLNHFNEINIATAYRTQNGETNELPYDLKTIEPVYKTIKGWKQPLDNVKTKDALPQALKDYIQWIENETGVPVTMISVGPDRKQIVNLK
ncbi:MAG: adenylosuccinate synthetase [Marinobacter sp.]